MSSKLAPDNQGTGSGEPATGHPSDLIIANVVRAYVAMVAIAGVAVVALTVVTSRPLPQPEVVALVIFCIAAGVGELVRVTVAENTVAISLSLAVVLAAMVVFGPIGAVATAVSAGLTFAVLHKPRPALRKTVFNTGMFAVAAGASALVYHLIGGRLGFRQITIIDVVAGSASLVTYFMVVWPMLLTIVYLTSGLAIRQVWEELRWMPVQVAVSAAIGFTLGIAYLAFSWAGVLVYIAPLLALREGMRQYTTKVRAQIDELTVAHAQAELANESLTAANRSLDVTNEGLLKTLAAVIDARDIFLYGHSVQASKYAGQVARKLGMDDTDVRTTELGALLHDLGKIGVSESILNKPARLTAAEYAEVKHHCDIGYQLLSNLPQFEEVADIVRSHHEHFDGSGYPRGLVGEQIPRGARVVSVVEAVEAMVSDRPYRKGLTADEVLGELARGAGSQWDPDVVEAFSGILSQDRKHLAMRNSALEIALSRLPIVELLGDNENGGATLAGMTATFRNTGEPIFILDDEFRVVSANPTAERILGCSEQDLQGKAWADLCVVQRVQRGGSADLFGGPRQVVLNHADGAEVHLDVTAAPLRTNSASYWLLLGHDISDRVRRESDLTDQVRSDFLTGIASRLELESRAGDAILTGIKPLTLVVLDMDGLKAINDTFGHPAGDAALKTLAAVMAAQVRQDDTVARLSGDEFAILMPGSTAEDAGHALRRIEDALPAAYATLDASIDFCSGVATWNAVESFAELLERADGLLIDEKRKRPGVGGGDVIPLKAARTTRG